MFIFLFLSVLVVIYCLVFRVQRYNLFLIWQKNTYFLSITVGLNGRYSMRRTPKRIAPHWLGVRPSV